jgi:hypothetical protein
MAAPEKFGDPVDLCFNAQYENVLLVADYWNKRIVEMGASTGELRSTIFLDGKPQMITANNTMIAVTLIADRYQVPPFWPICMSSDSFSSRFWLCTVRRGSGVVKWRDLPSPPARVPACYVSVWYCVICRRSDCHRG